MPDPAGVARRVLLAAVLCGVVAIARATCSDSGDRSDVVSFCFSSFKGVDNGDSRFDLSWDAGIVDGALHLTVDDVHKPPVYYPWDDRRWAGGIILRPSILLSVEPSYGYRLPSQQDASFNTTFTMSVISRSHNQAAAAIDDGGGLVFEIVPVFEDFDGRTGSNYGPTYESLASTTTAATSPSSWVKTTSTTTALVCMSPSRRRRRETLRRRTTLCGLTTTARPK